jgi:hypothetical protein
VTLLSLDSLLTLGGIAAFALVWLGLARNIASIARRDRNPPSFHPVLGAAHIGRFASWALVGGATLSTDPWTGVLLLTTRIPAVGLVAVTFLQRRECRPSARRIARTLVPLLTGMVFACFAVARLQPTLSVVQPSGALSFLPAATVLQYVLNAGVLACFAVQILYALPAQIEAAAQKPLGNLRWFQLGLLANYAYALVYAMRVQDSLVAVVMIGAYGAVLAEQALLVTRIERGIRRLRAGS